MLCEKKVEDPTVGKSIHNKAVQFTNFLSTIYFKVECNFNTSTKMQMQMRFMLIARNFTQIEMKCTANESTAAYWQMCVHCLQFCKQSIGACTKYRNRHLTSACVNKSTIWITINCKYRRKCLSINLTYCVSGSSSIFDIKTKLIFQITNAHFSACFRFILIAHSCKYLWQSNFSEMEMLQILANALQTKAFPPTIPANRTTFPHLPFQSSASITSNTSILNRQSCIC